MVSVIQDYGRTRVPAERWTPDAFAQLQEILLKVQALDTKLGEPNCEDPAKAAWMRGVEKRLAALETGA
jgi:ubiquitin-protein ligase